MKSPATIVQMLIRLLGVIVLVLGIVLWTGHGGTELEKGHQTLAILLVIALWVLAALAFKAGVKVPLVAVAVAWGFIAPILGFAQKNILTGSGHWVIQVLHLLVGLGVIGLGESLGANIKAKSAKA
jgi:hypothetical protein